jgi:glycosyltransferase involved in cell wall biosynthesis
MESNPVRSPGPAGLAVLLPAYDEAQTIAGCIRAFHAALPEAAIWVVDNRSGDETAAIARATLAELGCAGGVLHEARPGKANALRRGFLEIEAEAYLIADADLTYPADRARDLLAPILAGRADMVAGDRISAGHYAAENKRAFHGAGNRLVQVLVNRLFGARLADILSGYRAFSRAFVKGYPIVVEGFEVETDLTLHALDKRWRILEIPIEYRDRPAGSASKLNTFRDGARVLFVILQVLRYYRPLLFFGSLSLLMLAFALACSVPVFDDWVRFRYIYRVPLAVLSASSVVVAVLLGAVGLILDSVAHQQRVNYELAMLGRRPGGT